MTINLRQRWLILGSLLIASLAAALLAEDEPPPPSRGKTARAAGTSGSRPGEGHQTVGREKAPALAAVPLTFPEPQPSGEGQGEGKEPAAEAIDPFRSKSWYVAPPPPPPPKPSAPALPFLYLGKLNEAGEIRVFLNHQGQHLIVRTGDVINGTYSVEEIAGSRMRFLYLPLKETQVLSIGEDGGGAARPPSGSPAAGKLSITVPPSVDMGTTFKLAARLDAYPEAERAMVEIAYDKSKVDTRNGDGRVTLQLLPNGSGGLQGAVDFAVVAADIGETVFQALSASVEQRSGAEIRVSPPPPQAIRITP